jgi:Asp-tRNA(Asn)/Glu-tRNA(Gln) amidotransferase A subunit family amidase
MVIPARSEALIGGVEAVTLRDRLRSRELSCADVVAAFLAAVGDDRFRAWAAIDADGLSAQAAALDRVDTARREQLPLFGVPVAIKDNFDTVDLPTAYGSPIYAGHRPRRDAIAVERLRAAGAIIAGKTTCAEFAWMSPPDTVNPLCPDRTPGGSSTGSAVAVSAGTVPLATGTQTAGSVNRPASYCGVLGYKPSFGLIARAGIKPLAGSLDTVGLLARSVADLELAVGVLAGARIEQPDVADDARFAIARTPLWDRLDPDVAPAIEAALARLRDGGTPVEELELPAAQFHELVAAQTTIQSYEAAASLAPELRSPDALSDPLREVLIEGGAIGRERYAEAKHSAAELTPALVSALAEYDGVLTPSATGVPPLGLDFTGDPLFCRVWTLIGAPSISLPMAWTPDRLPVGVQLVGVPGSDARTLAAAAELIGRI